MENVNVNTNFNQFNTEEEETIDLLDLFRMLKDKWIVLLVSFIVGALAAGSFTYFLITPKYAASSMIYVYSKSTSITSLADIQLGSQLTVDFTIIASTRDVVETAAQECGITDSYENLVGKINVTNPSNSHILQITVTDEDPELATRLSNAMAHQLRIRIAEVMNSDMPSSVENAIVPVNPVSPSLKKNTAIGGAGLLLVVVAIYVIMYLLDDTIKSEEDVEKYLHQNVIAVVPVFSGKKQRRHSSKSSSKAATAN